MAINFANSQNATHTNSLQSCDRRKSTHCSAFARKSRTFITKSSEITRNSQGSDKAIGREINFRARVILRGSEVTSRSELPPSTRRDDVSLPRSTTAHSSNEFAGNTSDRDEQLSAGSRFPLPPASPDSSSSRDKR